jgi:hypothetical protein
MNTVCAELKGHPLRPSLKRYNQNNKNSLDITVILVRTKLNMTCVKSIQHRLY